MLIVYAKYLEILGKDLNTANLLPYNVASLLPQGRPAELFCGAFLFCVCGTHVIRAE